MLSQREQQIREFYNALDVHREIAFGSATSQNSLAPETYVETLHADGSFSPRRLLHRAIRNSASAERYYFTGMRGAGKSTELRRLRHDLEQEGCVAFYVDMTEYLSSSEPVEIGDFLLAVLSSLADGVHEDARFGGKDLLQQSAWQRLTRFLDSEVKLEGIDWSSEFLGQKLGFKFKIKENQDFRALLQKKSRAVIDRLVGESRTFVDGLVGFVRRKTSPDAKVVLLVDSMERLSGIGEGAKKVFDSVENLFGHHRDKLRFATLSTVYSVPPYISAVVSSGDSNLVYSLPLPKVFESPLPLHLEGKRRQPHEEGVKKLLEVVAKRFARWCDFFSEDLLRRLIRDTGGDLRELFLLLRESLNLVDPERDEDFPVSEGVIEHVEKLRRSQFGMISQSDMKWLLRVSQTHQHGLEDKLQYETLTYLLNGKLMYQYRNGDVWYDVHPLLWERVEMYGYSISGG